MLWAVLLTSESLPPERRVIPTHLLKSQLPFLLINCDHLLKSLKLFFSSWLIFNYIPKCSQLPYISVNSIFCPGWKKGKAGFFGRSCLIVNFLPFFCYIFQTSCFWGCDLTYLLSSEHESSVLTAELQNGLVWKGPLKSIQFQSPAMEVM